MAEEARTGRIVTTEQLGLGADERLRPGQLLQTMDGKLWEVAWEARNTVQSFYLLRPARPAGAARRPRRHAAVRQ